MQTVVLCGIKILKYSKTERNKVDDVFCGIKILKYTKMQFFRITLTPLSPFLLNLCRPPSRGRAGISDFPSTSCRPVVLKRSLEVGPFAIFVTIPMFCSDTTGLLSCLPCPNGGGTAGIGSTSAQCQGEAKV